MDKSVDVVLGDCVRDALESVDMDIRVGEVPAISKRSAESRAQLTL